MEENSKTLREGSMLQQVTAALWSPVEEAIERMDLEGHLAVLVLHSGFRASADSVIGSPWTAASARLLSGSPIPGAPLSRTHDVATLGVRLALGGDTDRTAEFADLCNRELARQPLPPAACLRDDERLLLGIAAGIGAAAPALAPNLTAILHGRQHTTPLRQRCLDIWAETLAGGGRSLNERLARQGFQGLTVPVVGRAPFDDDWIAAYWLAARLLDAPWEPADQEIRQLGDVIADGGRRVLATLAGGSLNVLDAAFLLDALSASPQNRIARASVVHDILRLIDSFPKAAAVLATRKRGRHPFAIDDEYDVQDLFHAMIQPLVPDIVEEDPAPKVAGHSTRLDFTSKATQIGFEIKHLKKPGDATTAREEILLDERTYQEHPYIETVIAFVSDPETHIALPDRTAFEADLSQTVVVGGRSVRYIVRVR